MQDIRRHAYGDVVGAVTIRYGPIALYTYIYKCFGPVACERSQREQCLSYRLFVERNIRLGGVEQALCLFEIYARSEAVAVERVYQRYHLAAQFATALCDFQVLTILIGQNLQKKSIRLSHYPALDFLQN